ncbi:MAG: hypothetical protein AAGK32_21895 [Actinomycetota bacterium]
MTAAGDAVTRAATRPLAVAALAWMVLSIAGCGDSGDSPDPATGPTAETSSAEETLFPDVVEVEVTPAGGSEFEVAATVSSPYDTPERYADAWRVLDEQGTELGVRELAHDHAGEQPFTRTLILSIPDDVTEITVEGRDQISGYGGATVTVAVPRD